MSKFSPAARYAVVNTVFKGVVRIRLYKINDIGVLGMTDLAVFRI